MPLPCVRANMKTPDINKILAAHPRRRGFTDDTGKFVCTGSHMGASDNTDDLSEPLYVQRIRFVDGEYAADGTYWGGGGSRLYCAFNPATNARIYVRAVSRAEAIIKLTAGHDGIKFK